MEKHKIDVYVDGSLAKDNYAGIGIYIEFNGSKYIELGVRQKKKNTNIEVVELLAVQSALSRLDGSHKTNKVSNSEITIYTDSSHVERFFNNGIEFKSMKSDLKGGCLSILDRLCKEKFNNTIKFIKISSDENKAHDLAYQAAVNGAKKSAGSFTELIELSKKKRVTTEKSKTIVKKVPTKNTEKIENKNSLVEIAELLLQEAKRVSLLESELSVSSKTIESLQDKLNKLKTENNDKVKEYKSKIKELSNELNIRDKELSDLKKENESLLNKIDLREENYKNSILAVEAELEMYKKKVARLDKQRKLRLLKERMSRTMSSVKASMFNNEKEVLSQVACSSEIVESDETKVTLEENK